MNSNWGKQITLLLFVFLVLCGAELDDIFNTNSVETLSYKYDQECHAHGKTYYTQRGRFVKSEDHRITQRLHFVNEDNCKKCPDNCVECYFLDKDHTQCSLCKWGYYLDLDFEDECQMCAEGCAECTGPETSSCFRVMPGYWYYESKKEISKIIIKGCDKARKDGTCINCLPHLVCQSEIETWWNCDECRKCKIKNCDYCIYDPDIKKDVCMWCSPTYYLKNDECLPSNIANCPWYTEDGDECAMCEVNYGITRNSIGKKTCQHCAKYCTTCKDEECLSCEKGYGLTKDGECKRCPGSCLYCYDEECIVCKNNGYASEDEDNNCKKDTCDDENCIICSSSKCYLCAMGYELDSKNECKSVELTHIKGCKDQELDVCLSCDAGYYLNYDSKQKTVCSQCHESCATCSGPYKDNCISCYVGNLLYYEYSTDFVNQRCVSTCPSKSSAGETIYQYSYYEMDYCTNVESSTSKKYVQPKYKYDDLAKNYLADEIVDARGDIYGYQIINSICFALISFILIIFYQVLNVLEMSDNLMVG